MTTRPQTARARREMLTTMADAAARPPRVVRRRSPVGGATFSQPLGLGFLRHPQAALADRSQTAAALGVDLTPQALEQRGTAAAAACLQEGLHAALARVVATAPVALPRLARVTAVWLQESATLVLPDALAPVWQGCGGSTSARPTAALTRQVRLERRTGRVSPSSAKRGGPPIRRPSSLARATLARCTWPPWATGVGTQAARCRHRGASGGRGSRSRRPLTRPAARATTAWRG
jgi:hypothetical protein